MSDSTFERIVPSFEMCSRIPEGMFEDSCLVWIESGRTGSRGVIQRRPALPDWVKVYPAPTLSEILADMERREGKRFRLVIDSYEGYGGDCYGDHPEEDALLLWIKQMEALDR